MCVYGAVIYPHISMSTAISSSASQTTDAQAFQGQEEILALEEKEDARLNAAKKKLEDEEQKVRAAEEEKRAAAEQQARDKARSMLQSVAEKDMPAIGAVQDTAAEKECADLKKAFASKGGKIVDSLVEEFVSSLS